MRIHRGGRDAAAGERLLFGETHELGFPERDFVRVEREQVFSDSESGTPGGTRIPNLLIRSQTLYPIELRVLCVIRGAERSRVLMQVSRKSPRFVGDGSQPDDEFAMDVVHCG